MKVPGTKLSKFKINPEIFFIHTHLIGNVPVQTKTSSNGHF